MKVMTKTVLSAALMVAATMASGTALAHGHGHTSVGIGVGFGFPGYWYGPGPYYYPPAYPYYAPYPAAYGYPAEPTAYVEQGASAAPAGQGQWWYYCNQAQAYYPYVRECAGGWQRVAPTPPAQQ